MDLLVIGFWACWTLFFGFIFMDQFLKGVKRLFIHFYFRGKAHFDVESDYNNREQLSSIEGLFSEHRVNMIFHLNDSNKTLKKQVAENKELLKQIKTKIDELGRED